MAIPEGLTTELGNGAALSVDFVNQFGRRVNALQDVLKVTRKITVANGGTFKTYAKGTATLAVSPDKGAEIPLSEVVLGAPTSHEISWQKHRKAVALEDIQAYGFVRAIAMTDDVLLRQLQSNIKTSFYAHLQTGTGTATGVNLQNAMAQAWASVKNVFGDEAAEIITFVNPFDVADYTGNANVTMQTAHGLTYLSDFLGHDIVVVDSNIAQGEIVTTVANNLVLVNANVAGGDIAQAGFDFVMDDSGLIGVTHYINQGALRAETVTASGIKLFAERLDGVIKTSIEAADAEG